MEYLKKIGINSKRAFEKLKNIKHSKIQKVLENYNTSILKNKKIIIRENVKDIRNNTRKH